MDIIEKIFELIDMRSFSNLWFWIVLAVLWSTVSHWVIGVPWDMVVRARKSVGRQAEDAAQRVADLQDLVRINCNRIVMIAEQAGLFLCAVVFFTLTTLGLLGFVYNNEFSQAVFLLALPLSILGLLSLRTARIIRRDALSDDALYRRLHRHRVATQAIGMLSIFVTAMWGMLQNFANGPFGY
ncbi:MAG: component of SufBCD complex [Pseudomonadota bacterium]